MIKTIKLIKLFYQLPFGSVRFFTNQKKRLPSAGSVLVAENLSIMKETKSICNIRGHHYLLCMLMDRKVTSISLVY